MWSYTMALRIPVHLRSRVAPARRRPIVGARVGVGRTSGRALAGRRRVRERAPWRARAAPVTPGGPDGTPASPDR